MTDAGLVRDMVHELLANKDAEIAELQRQLAAAKEDTIRLDWLAGRKYACFGTHYHGRWCVQIETEGYAESGFSLREAIDKASK